MNWKLKGPVQSVVSVLAGVTSLNYWAQKYITRAHENSPSRARDDCVSTVCLPAHPLVEAFLARACCL